VQIGAWELKYNLYSLQNFHEQCDVGMFFGFSRLLYLSFFLFLIFPGALFLMGPVPLKGKAATFVLTNPMLTAFQSCELIL